VDAVIKIQIQKIHR